MRVEKINSINFGLRKLTSFADLAKQKCVDIVPIESNDMIDMTNYIKMISRKVKWNFARAIESAKKVIIR